jgi:hypothetical protein
VWGIEAATGMYLGGLVIALAVTLVAFRRGQVARVAV